MAPQINQLKKSYKFKAFDHKHDGFHMFWCTALCLHPWSRAYYYFWALHIILACIWKNFLFLIQIIILVINNIANKCMMKITNVNMQLDCFQTNCTTCLWPLIEH